MNTTNTNKTGRDLFIAAIDMPAPTAHGVRKCKDAGTHELRMFNLFHVWDALGNRRAIHSVKCLSCGQRRTVYADTGATYVAKK